MDKITTFENFIKNVYKSFNRTIDDDELKIVELIANNIDTASKIEERERCILLAQEYFCNQCTDCGYLSLERCYSCLKRNDIREQFEK